MSHVRVSKEVIACLPCALGFARCCGLGSPLGARVVTAAGLAVPVTGGRLAGLAGSVFALLVLHVKSRSAKANTALTRHAARMRVCVIADPPLPGLPAA